MGSRKKRRAGANPAEVLLLIAKAEEKLAKKTKEETKTKNNIAGHRDVAGCRASKDISADEAQEKAKDKTRAKTKDKTGEKAYTKPIKKVKDESGKNIKQGASAEEMLLLIAKAEERSAKEAKEEARIENIAGAKTEERLTTESKERQSFDAPPAKTKKFFTRIFRYLFRQ